MVPCCCFYYFPKLSPVIAIFSPSFKWSNTSNASRVGSNSSNHNLTRLLSFIFCHKILIMEDEFIFLGGLKICATSVCINEDIRVMGQIVNFINDLSFKLLIQTIICGILMPVLVLAIIVELYLSPLCIIFVFELFSCRWWSICGFLCR